MSVIEAIRNYIKEDCPLLKEGKLVNIDNIEKDPTNYSITSIPATTKLQSYINGDSLRAKQFLFLARNNAEFFEDYAENQDFFDSFAEWLETQTDGGLFPVLGEGKTAKKIEALNAGFLSDFDESGQSAVYQITCQLTYRQKGA